MEVLERRLGLKAVIAISISSMLGPGIFVLPGVAASEAGNALWVAYVLAIFCIIPAAISKSELATAMPTSGGTYVHTERTFGPLVGTVSGLGLWMALLFKSSFALMGIGAYLETFADIPVKETAVGLLALILILNIVGVGKLSGILMFVVSLGLASLTGLSFGLFLNGDFVDTGGTFNLGLSGILPATATLFVAYAGVIKVAAIAEEIKDPNKIVPRGIIYSLLIVSALYMLVAVAYTGTIGTHADQKDFAPIFSMAYKLGGQPLGYVFSFIAIFTMASMANAGVLAASRFPFAMSRDDLLPKQLGVLSQKFLTPVNSIVASCLLVLLAILAMDVERVAKFSSVFMILTFVVVNFTVVVLRETRVQWYNPGFKGKFYPSLQIFGIVSGLVLLSSLSDYFVWAMVSTAFPGLIIYFFYGKKKVDRRGVVGIRGARKDLLGADPGIRQNVEFPVLNDKMRHAEVVVSLYGKERSPDTLIELGIAIADHHEVEVVYLTEVPEQTSVHDIGDSAAVRSLARRIKTMARKNETIIYFDPVTSHDIFATINEISQRLHSKWLIREWGGTSRGTVTQHNQMGWIVEHLNCHLVTFRDNGIRYFRKILVYFHPGQISKLTIDLAVHLAKIHDASVTVVSFLGNDAEIEALEAAREDLAAASQSIEVPIAISVVKTEDSLSNLVDLTVDYDMLVFLDSGSRSKLKTWFGSEADRIISKAACSVVSLRESKSLLEQEETKANT